MRYSKRIGGRLIILTEHFYPSTGATAQLITDLSFAFHNSDSNILILTSTPSNVDSPFPVVRLSPPLTASSGLVQKTLTGLYFFFSSLLWLVFNANRGDQLFIVSNPPFIAFIGPLLSFLRALPYSFLLQDVFPRSAVLTGVLPSRGPVVSLWKKSIRAVIKHSQSTIVLSEAMQNRCNIDFGSDLTTLCIPNWSIIPPSVSTKISSHYSKLWNTANYFTVQYSGNFGRLHDILTILEAARILKNCPIKFVFVGGGAKFDLIKRYLIEYKLSNVQIHPYQPREQLSNSISACDVSIVSLIPGSEDTVAPSKYYGILSSSRPILLIASQDSPIAHEVLSSHAGLVAEPGDSVLLSQHILYLSNHPSTLDAMSKSAYKLYHSRYGMSPSLKKYIEHFSKLREELQVGL